MENSKPSEAWKENLMGLLRIRIKRGIDLAVGFINISDPYVTVRLDNQKLKTRVAKKGSNPQWNDDLTLCITDPSQPIKLFVYDNNVFTFKGKMGETEFDLGPFLEGVKMNPRGVPDGTIIRRVTPGRQNCLVEESHVAWVKEEVVQRMFLRLNNVKRGEIELELKWIHVPGSRGLF